MMNLRFKWVGRWSNEARQYRFFRVMWERYESTPGRVQLWSYKLSVSVKNYLPRVTLRKGSGLFV